MPEATATVRKRRVGRILRQLREQSGLTHEQASKEVGFSTAKISRIESGHVSKMDRRDVRDLLEVYQAPAELRERVHEMAREANKPGFWQPYEDILPKGFEMYVSLEADAAAISTFDTYMIPGLLQTPEYVRALAHAERPTEDHGEIERLVELRKARQELLTREEQPLRLWAIVDEAALRRMVDGPAVMRAQLDHLIAMIKRGYVEVQVLPFGVGAHVAMSGSFFVIEFAEPTDPDMAYVDCAAGNIYVENPEDVRRLKTRFSHLQTEALKPRQSVTFLRKLVKELE